MSWRSYRIKRLVHSSTEAEYVTCSDASRQAEYHINVLGELGLYEAGGGLQIFTDSKGAEALVGNPVQRQRTKYIGAPYHYVRQLVQEGVVGLQRVASEDNAADVLTTGDVSFRGLLPPFSFLFSETEACDRRRHATLSDDPLLSSPLFPKP